MTTRIPRGERTPESAIGFDSRIELSPTVAQDPSYLFLDEARQIALFRSESMMEYREAFENWYASGNWSENRVRAAKKIYERVHGASPPDDAQQLIAGIPSATQTILELFQEMKAAGTQTLIVDLRRNQGGNSLLSWIFSYVLHGSRESLAANADRFQVRRYSQLYFDNNRNRSIESIGESLGEHLEIGDYSFSGYREYEAFRDGDVVMTDDDVASVRRFLEKVPSCAPLFEDAENEALYQPEHVVLLCSSVTYSAGFDLLVDLYKAGAILVGTPSAQTGNCFIDSIRFELPQTGITGNLSCKYRELFPGDPQKGEVLEPHHRLTHELWAGYDFDPNAEVLLALDRLGLQSKLR